MNNNIFTQNSNSLKSSQGVSKPPEREDTNTATLNSERISNLSFKGEQTVQNEVVKSLGKNGSENNSQQPSVANKQIDNVFAKEAKDLISKEISSGLRQSSNNSLFWYMLLSKWERDRQKRRKR